ncbi:MAG: protease [Chitinophagaceae bacterium]|nr:MAG: protease [Chitinophagaceae bacterium]
MFRRFFLTAVSCALLLLSNAQQKGYYRMPSISGNTIVFVAEGDLWKYNLSAKTTARLTTHAGLEDMPFLSPDGKQLVFSGQYEGPSELYLMSVDGGIPKRLTYDLGATSQATGWTSDNKIIISSSVESSIPSLQLSILDPVTLSRQPIPLWQASFGSTDNNGTLYFTRFPNQGSKTKRYKGGFIEQVWKFDGKNEAVNLTADFDGTSTNPVFYKDRVYFLSDRDGTMNLWSMNASGKDLVQHTQSKAWDLQNPSISNGQVVYQKGADLWLYNIETKKEQLLDITLLSDFDQRKPKWVRGPVSGITDAAISPNGAYAAIISRGRVFVSPAKSDRWVEPVRKSGIRFKDAQFINNKTLAVLSDASGEYEVWKMSADGSDTAVQVTRNSKVLINMYAVSPDEKLIAYKDKNETFHVAEVSSGKIIYKLDSLPGSIEEFSWSPDNRFLAYTEALENTNLRISVLDRSTWKSTPITTDRLNSYQPSWTADSSWVYFVSERHLVSTVTSPWGSRAPEPYYTQTKHLYALALDSTAKFPFLATDSWLNDTTFTRDNTKPADTKKPKKEKPAPRTYDWTAISKRIYTVPTKNANIDNSAIANGYLYWTESGLDPDAPSKLFALKMEESKTYEPTEVASGVVGVQAAADGKKLILFLKNRTIAIVDANGAKADLGKAGLNLSNWAFLLDPQEEWKEMFNDAWRMMRDYFYDRDMHQVDWAATKKQYEPLLERLTDRFELDDILGQMVGELSALHHFVGGGDKRRSPDMIQTGFLGATLSKTGKGIRIDHIYQSDPDFPDNNSPLRQAGLRIHEGDIITAVNNVKVDEVADLSMLLANKVNVPVKLDLSDAAGKAYQQVVSPISQNDAFTLRYEEWEYMNRLKVDTMSNNKIGYIHLKAMTGNDIDDFVKQYYPIFNREGLVLDVRMNNGGNIDSWILEKLMRKIWMYWQGRSGAPYWNMQYAFRGHMVIICDQMTASDGEAVCEGFRRLGLGKVIGMRTWGGEIWLTGSNRLVDNGIASAAEFGVYGAEGKWLIEGRGVEPDIEVDNLPFESFKGKDAQLEYAIDYLKKMIKEKPVVTPPAPKHPDKSFKY